MSAVAFLVFAAGPAAAQYAHPTVPIGAPTIEDAAESRDWVGFDLAIVAAIAENPATVESVVRRALASAPDRRDTIIELVTKTFPGFADQVARAANAPTPTGAGTAPPKAVAGSPPEPASATSAAMPASVSKWSGEIALGGAVTTGNTETERVNAAIAATNTRPKWTHRFGLTYDFAADGGSISADRLVANAETNYDITDRVYSLGFAEYEDDRFGGFDYVLTVTTGLGYRLITGDPVTLMVDAGPGLRHSKRRDGGSDNEPIGRGRIRLRWQVSENATFTNDTIFITGSDRTTTENKAALTADVVGDLKARLAFDVRHNSSPPAGADATDTETKASLVYTF